MLLVYLLWSFLVSPGRSQVFDFRDVTTDSGLSAPLLGMMGHAAAWGDFDRDGLPDLFVGGFCDRPDSDYLPAKKPVPTRLFRNLGNGKFEVVKKSPTEFFSRTSGALFADLNNDGFPELYVANHSKKEASQRNEPQATAEKMRNRLFRNARGKLIDFSKESGSCPPDLLAARNVAVFDYNADGLLDVFLVEDKFRTDNRQARSLLLKNTGNLKFQIANGEAGIPNDLFGLGLALADLNNDGLPEIFLPHSNRWLLSGPGRKYREVMQLNSTLRWNPLDTEDWPCGAAFGDLNLDGRLDLVISIHHEPARNKVFINKGLRDGIPVFEDVTAKVGLGLPVPAKSPHVEIQDFDNDGLPDLYFSAAWKNGQRVIPLIYRNAGIAKTGLPYFMPPQEIKPPMIYFPAGPTVDFNRDGGLDIFLVNWFRGESFHLLKNQTRRGNWLQVKAPIGTKVRVFSNGKLVGFQQVYIGFGYASGQLPVCHFGLRDLKSVDLEITLPDGTVQRSNKVQVNRIMEFPE